MCVGCMLLVEASACDMGIDRALLHVLLSEVTFREKAFKLEKTLRTLV